jgi:hypothetical protein
MPSRRPDAARDDGYILSTSPSNKRRVRKSASMHRAIGVTRLMTGKEGFYG